MAVGLGGEKLWLSPTVANNVNPFDDQSGQGNNGTAQGGLSTVADTGAGGAYCYDFDGIDDYIDCGAIGVSSGLSISAWVKRDEVANFVGIVTRYDEAAATDSCYYLMSSASGDGIRLYASQGSGVLKGEDYAGSVGDASWSHVAMRVGLGTDRGEIFVDGLKVVSVQVDNDNMSSFLNTAGMDTLIGARRNSTGASKYFNGLVDDVRIYNRALTQSEISWLATERGVLGTPPEGLGDEYGWWCPSLDANADGLTNLAGGADATLKLAGEFGVVSDTGSGGTKAWEGTGAGNSGINTGAVPLVNNDFSMACWFKQDAGASGFQEIMAVEDPGARDYLQCRVNNGAMATDFNGLTMSEPTDLRSGWHHVVVTLDYSGNAASQYIDGVVVNSGTMSNGWSQNLGEWEIGSQGRSGTLVFDGLLDDSRIYNRVLTQAEITHLATSRGVLGPPGQATHYNPFKSHAFINDFQQRLK